MVAPYVATMGFGPESLWDSKLTVLAAQTHGCSIYKPGCLISAKDVGKGKGCRPVLSCAWGTFNLHTLGLPDWLQI